MQQLATPNWGVSPRERGNLGGESHPPLPLGCIPARAGEPRHLQLHVDGIWVYPRASGGTRERLDLRAKATGVSPRERGNRLLGHTHSEIAGCIPARAGEPQFPREWRVPEGVYPRASGGTVDIRDAVDLGKGVSPRERGNPELLEDDVVAIGCIPARAGEPCGC